MQFNIIGQLQDGGSAFFHLFSLKFYYVAKKEDIVFGGEQECGKVTCVSLAVVHANGLTTQGASVCEPSIRLLTIDSKRRNRLSTYKNALLHSDSV